MVFSELEAAEGGGGSGGGGDTEIKTETDQVPYSSVTSALYLYYGSELDSGFSWVNMLALLGSGSKFL